LLELPGLWISLLLNVASLQTLIRNIMDVTTKLDPINIDPDKGGGDSKM